MSMRAGILALTVLFNGGSIASDGAPASTDAESHWAFTAPIRPVVPRMEAAATSSPIDAFVLDRLKREGLAPSPEADRRTLLRRVTFDVTGLPPTPAEIEAFCADTQPGAYDRVVERLLDSPHFGERMAVMWLDLARYADTNGYSIDGGRHMWAWRDWVINAFNANMPFDQFTVEQLAGDLLENPTVEQLIATGFNRNHMNTHEGGTIEEEYRVAYVADRVRTTAQAWLGLTMNCAQCHDHKYDPISQQEYYRFYAFFNTITDRGNDGNAGVNSVPYIPVFDDAQQATLQRVRDQLAAARVQLARPDEALDAEQARWEAAERDVNRALPALSAWSIAGPFTAASANEAFTTAFIDPAAIDLHALSETGEPRWVGRPEFADGVVHPLAGTRAAWYLVRTITAPEAHTVEVSLGSDDAVAAWLNGQAVLSNNTRRGAAPDQERVSLALREGANTFVLKIVNDGGPAGFYFDVLRSGPPDEIVAILNVPVEQRTAEQAQKVRSSFRATTPLLADERDAIAQLEAQIAEVVANPRTTTMVMEEMAQPRESFVLERGRYDLHGARVEPGTPGCLPAFPADTPRTRLGLAQWLVDPAHPLTARVAVNHLWQMLFGNGLVSTSEDFGVRGERPSHPELLDWLAVEFIESGWDVKAMLRMMVTSATYRQSSTCDAALRERDPDNRLLARGPRFRLHAEFLRDAALAASGLLVPEIGGPSVRPYQPEGLWKEMSHFGSTPATEQVYVQDTGEKLYRRSLYTIWKRTVPPPPMMAFDAPSREVCISRRSRTNTPLQALVLLNETGFVEAARALGQRIILEGGPTDDDRLRFGFLLVTGREPDATELSILYEMLEHERGVFARDPEAAVQMLTVGESPREQSIDPVEHAVWMFIANTLFNLSEASTRG